MAVKRFGSSPGDEIKTKSSNVVPRTTKKCKDGAERMFVDFIKGKGMEIDIHSVGVTDEKKCRKMVENFKITKNSSEYIRTSIDAEFSKECTGIFRFSIRPAVDEL